MTEPMATISIENQEGLPEVIARLRAISGPVRLDIPNASPLLLTATEFRMLRDHLGAGHTNLIVMTSDPLRVQLAGMFGLKTAAAAPPALTLVRPAAPPPRPTNQGPSSNNQVGRSTVNPERRPGVITPSPTVVRPVAAERLSTDAHQPKVNQPQIAPIGGDQPNPETVSFADRTRVARPPAGSPPGPTDVPPALLALAVSGVSPGDKSRSGIAGWREKLKRTNQLPSEAGPAANSANDPVAVGQSRRLSRRGLALALGGGLLLLVLAAAIAYVAFSSATVSLVMKQQVVTGELVIGVTAADDTPVPGTDLSLEAIPVARSVRGTWTVATTGIQSEPDGSATGTIDLANPTDDAVVVPADTVVTSRTGVKYRVTEDVEIPGRSQTKVPGGASVTVAAVAPGSGSNLGQGELSGRIAELGVYFSNRGGDIRGGSDRDVQVVADEDIQALRAQAEGQLADLAVAAFAADSAGRWIILPDSLTIAEPALTFTNQRGEAAATITMNAEADVSALGFSPDAAIAAGAGAIQARLAESLPSGYAIAPADIVIATPIDPSAPAPDGRFRLPIRAVARAVLDSERKRALTSDLVGKDRNAAEELLASDPMIEQYRLSFSPGWLPERMPTTARQIEIETTR